MKKKTTFALFIFFAHMLGFGLYGYYHIHKGIAAPQTQAITQIITADSTTSRTVIWQTDPTEVTQSLEYKQKNDRLSTTLDAKTVDLPTNGDKIQRHAVTLRNLTPGTTYQYRVGSKANWSDWKKITTPSTSSHDFKAILFGDSQCADYAVWEKTAQAAWQSNPDAAFYINMGDLVDNGQDFHQWKAWFNGLGDMKQQIPLAPISGNHENYSLDWKFAPADLYLTLFPLPANGPADLLGQAYSFDYGDIHFSILDTQAEELAEAEPDLIAKQAVWLKEDLQKTTKKWKIVLTHRSLFALPRNPDKLNDLGEAFVPIFDQYKVDVVFSAHIHAYGRTRPLINGKPAKQGTIYISTGRTGDKTWDKAPRKPVEIFFENPLDQPNYLTLTHTGNTIKITNYKQNGTVVDEVSLKK